MTSSGARHARVPTRTERAGTALQTGTVFARLAVAVSGSVAPRATSTSLLMRGTECSHSPLTPQSRVTVPTPPDHVVRDIADSNLAAINQALRQGATLASPPSEEETH